MRWRAPFTDCGAVASVCLTGVTRAGWGGAMAGDSRSVPVRTWTTRVAPYVAIAFLQVLILARSPHASTQAASGSVPEDVSAAGSPGDSPATGAQSVASAGGAPS